MMKTVGDGNDKPRPASEARRTPRIFAALSCTDNDFHYQELPIDINYAKLADWLLDRQKIKAEWRNALRHIQDKVGSAVENLPDNPVLNAVKAGCNCIAMHRIIHADVAAKSSSHSIAMQCKKIRDVMTSEKDTAQKNWLGQYKNQATKDWEAILAL
eukprot:2695258-Rhodomonas_salina.2